MPPLHAKKRHQSENAALAVIVDAHGDGDVFDRGDQKQRPEQERQHAKDAVRRNIAAENVESRLERIEWARADIAEYDAESREPGHRKSCPSPGNSGIVDFGRCSGHKRLRWLASIRSACIRGPGTLHITLAKMDWLA